MAISEEALDRPIRDIDAKRAQKHAEEIERLRQEKKRERLHKKLVKESQERWQRRQQLVVPFLFFATVLITLLIWLLWGNR